MKGISNFRFYGTLIKLMRLIYTDFSYDLLEKNQF